MYCNEAILSVKPSSFSNLLSRKCKALNDFSSDISSNEFKTFAAYINYLFRDFCFFFFK
jgi:hypothetical protein